jgi:hypothetical protein
MNIKENKTFETSAKNIAYIIILPVIILASAVWFVEDSIAVTVAHLFQLICSLVFYFTSGYIWSLKSKKELSIFKFYLIFYSQYRFCFIPKTKSSLGKCRFIYGVIFINELSKANRFEF